MIRAAIAFFVLGLVAMALGATGFAGVSIEIGRTLVVVFMIFAVVSFLVSLLTGRRGTYSGLMSFLALAALVGVAGCSSAEKVADEAAAAPAQETISAAEESRASHVSEVTFDQGSFVLSEGSRAALSGMINKAKTSGKVGEVKVLAWADAAYPSEAQKKLSKADRELANKRAEAIRGFIRSQLAGEKVDTYNMAERPNAVQGLFNTSDARLKNALENAGVTSNEGKSLTGKASRAVVMVMMDTHP